MTLHLPLIVSLGGVNPAGRISCHHAYRRTVIEALSADKADATFAALKGLMCLDSSSRNQLTRDYILKHTLVRELESVGKNGVPFHRRSTIQPNQEEKVQFDIPTRHFPRTLPDNCRIVEQTKTRTRVELTGPVKVLFPDRQVARVTSAGQLPTGFDPSTTYPSRNHPRGLQLALVGASDALHSLGIPWEAVKTHVKPTEISVFAGSAMGQCDENSLAGVLQAPFLGKRPTSKQAAFGLSEMPADFVNAYVVGSVGPTAGIIGACATFLYNLKQAVDSIMRGRTRIAIAGGAEAPITPELMECYRIMGALSADEDLMQLDGTDTPNHRRSCRPFSTNAGFTLAEASVYVVLMEESLALELGTTIYGSVPAVFVNSDGFKKSIPGPGVGNYLTVAQAVALAQAIVGSESIQQRSFIHAHGTGTPQNRVTESHILNEVAKVFDVQDWHVTAIKSYLGHTLAAASGDQVASAIGTWNDGWIPGITTIDHIADDVFHSNLKISNEHIETDPKNPMEVAFVNSKGFGGNNATGILLSPQKTLRMLENRFGKELISKYWARNSLTVQKISEYDHTATQSGIPTVYKFGEEVLDGENIKIDQEKIIVDGWQNHVDLDFKNPYLDMCD